MATPQEEPDVQQRKNIKGHPIAAIRCRSLVRRYADVVAVDGVDLEIPKGECFGLLGPNGAGKTTTVEILEGINQPDSGTVELLGSRWGDGKDRALRERLGVQLQETRFSEKLTVEETVGLFRSFFRFGPDVSEVIRTVELTEKHRTRVVHLSGGQRQRLALACAIVGDPEILFLDEPTTGLDPQARLKFWELIDRFRSKGVTVMLTTHYMEEAARLCDRVAIMDRGRVIALGRPSHLVESVAGRQTIEFRASEGFDSTVLGGLPGVNRVSARNGDVLLSVTQVAEVLPLLMGEIRRQGQELAHLYTHQPTLEDVFIQLTGRNLRDG
jgi:ABC-2 type transport system ATP-binding protein